MRCHPSLSLPLKQHSAQLRPGPHMRSSPVRRPLCRAIESGLPDHQRGFSLLGIILVSALGAAVLGVAATAYVQNERAADVSQSTVSTRDLNNRVLASYASAADFSGLTNSSALNDKLFPKSVMQSGSPQNAWSGAITISALNIATPSGPGNNNGFVISYENVDPSACPRFAINAASGFYDVKINGASAMNGKAVSPNVASSLCATASGPSVVQFIQAKASPQGAPNPELTPCVIAPGQTQMVACPAGQISSVSPYSVNGITQTRYAFCNSSYGTMGWSPWVNASSTCAPICTPPASIQDTATQTASCGAGRVTPAGASTFPQTETRTISYSCPAPTGPYTTNYGPYAAWTPTEAAACAPKCVAPANTTQSQNITGSCPGGQVTVSGATTFGQTQTRAVNYACPAPTGSYTTSYGGWSAGTPAASSVCAPQCVAPAPSAYNNYQWVTVNAGCPAGYSGSHTYQVQQYQTVTTTYSCPSPQGGYATSSSAGGWANTGATQADSNNCVPPPPPAPTCLKTTDVQIVSSQICVGYETSAPNAAPKCYNNFTQGQLYSGSNRQNMSTNYALSAAYTVVYQGKTYVISGSCTVSTNYSLSTCNFPTGNTTPGLPGLSARGMANTGGSQTGSVYLESSLGSSCP